jgi:hypothetical protein
MNQCSHHKTWHDGVAGACPECMSKTMKDEKERIDAECSEELKQ